MRAAQVETDGSVSAAVAERVLRTAADALLALAERVDASFDEAVELMLGARGRVIVAGVGKSGIIGRKIAATLTSTGTPASFLHPVEALHGDLGLVSSDDVALLLSKSGETDELRGLVEFFARTGVSLIALTGRPDSWLGRQAKVVMDCSVREEACPHGLAPTTSTTAALAMGDALAVALLERRGFGREDFARLHPAGTLGRRSLLRVGDVMVADELPVVRRGDTMRACVVVLAKRRGTLAVLDGDNRLIGVITAGDLTRLMEREEHFLEVTAGEVMSTRPRTARPADLAAAAAGSMERAGVMALPVLDEADRLIGMVHLHDLMRAGAI